MKYFDSFVSNTCGGSGNQLFFIVFGDVVFLVVKNIGVAVAVIVGVYQIGTAAVTTRGLGTEEMKRIAHCIALTAKDFDGTQAEVLATVADICEQFPLYK